MLGVNFRVSFMPMSNVRESKESDSFIGLQLYFTQVARAYCVERFSMYVQLHPCCMIFCCKSEKLIILLKITYFWSSISRNLGDRDKIWKMHIALSYIVNQSQLAYFVSISKQKSVSSSGTFYNVLRNVWNVY